MTNVWRLRSDKSALYSKGQTDLPYGTVPTGGTARLGRFRGRSVYSTGPVDPPTWTWPPPDSTWAAAPSQPSVNYVDYYTIGDDLRAVLGKIQSYCLARGTGSDGYRQVVLPNGFDQEFADFPMANTNKLGLYYDRLLGFIGPGENNARIRLKRLSSTTGAGGTMLRLAGAGGVSLPGGLIPLHYGYTLQGNRQPDQTYSQGGGTGPELYAGLVHYRQLGGLVQRVRFQGTSCANWNSPPGETFSINSYKTKNAVWRGVEVDGRDASGERWGGSPFGGNNSDGDLLEDCWMHHSYRSGFTHSFTGTFTDINAISKNVTTNRLRLEHNANISPRVTGSGFAGINMENVGGTVTHTDVYIQVDNSFAPAGWAWNAGHASINNFLADNPNITFDNPTWTALHPRYSGCFVVNYGSTYAGGPQKQVTPPTVINKYGNPMTCISWTGGSGGTPPVVDPDLNFFWLKA